MSVETACEHTYLAHSSEGEASGDGPAARLTRIGGWVLYVTARSTAFGKEIRPISKQHRSGVKPFSMIPDILGTMPAGMVYLSSHFPVLGVKHEVTLKMGARLTTTDGTIPNAKHSASGNSLRDIENERHSKPNEQTSIPRQSGISFVNCSHDEKQRTRKEGF
ncbi:hypothetical protein NEUTE1DRAFT_103537 [Neurospora tetrasperma FGSC 2508]|uniref:Uncharacterized protein n=1 Tax=Neurospora tetrasperma (strain FGSC 2508 / ATCC MYA-4615 / P0657) TaxID=510951 RepID=F8MW68_NEUT8|nr:uncharacterized protein NEUTE1DRAFT_103537 [Neurospora tetrasperma FGSC 2508]EGO54063.1 hypothetical protein NEUTE1DRAFT_103537 [Neurospora tetrasperma FGSC 2508]